MGHVAALDRFHVLDAYYFAYHSALEGLVHCPEIWAVTEHVTHSHDTAVFVGLFGDVRTFFLCLGNRFFQKAVITPLQRLHTRVIVNVVRCGNNHCVSEFRYSEHFAPIAETMLLRDIEPVSHGILPAFADIGHAYNLHTVREHLCIVGISAATVSRPDDDHLDRAVLDSCLQSFDRKVHLRVSKKGIVHRNTHCLAGSLYSLACTKECRPGSKRSKALEKILSIHCLYG